MYCDSCGDYGHTFVYTDPNGFYNQAEAHAGITPLLVNKKGYEVIGSVQNFADGTGTKNALVNGDTRFDSQVARR